MAIKNKKEMSMYLGAFSLALVVFGEFLGLIGLTRVSLFVRMMTRAGLIFALISFVLSLGYSLTTPMTPETRKTTRVIQLMVVIMAFIAVFLLSIGWL